MKSISFDMKNQYNEPIIEYMLSAASNLIVAVVSKNPDKAYSALANIEETIGSYVEAARTAPGRRE